MVVRLLEVGLWSVFIVAATSTLIMDLKREIVPAAEAGVPTAGEAVVLRTTSAALRTAGAELQSDDPFALPATDSETVLLPPREAAPPTPRLGFALTGILGGPPWVAVLEGWSGPSGELVEAGDRMGAIVVRAVAKDSIVLGDENGTWTLKLPESLP